MAHTLDPLNPEPLYLWGNILFTRYGQRQDNSLLLMAGMKLQRAVRLSELKAHADLLWNCGQRLLEQATESSASKDANVMDFVAEMFMIGTLYPSHSLSSFPLFDVLGTPTYLGRELQNSATRMEPRVDLTSKVQRLSTLCL